MQGGLHTFTLSAGESDLRDRVQELRLTIQESGAMDEEAHELYDTLIAPASEAIETALRKLSSAESSSFASRWRGKFQTAEHDDARYRALAKKYL